MPSKIEISLYDSTNIDTCPWPDTEEGKVTRAFLEPLLRGKIKDYIENADTQIAVLIAGDIVFPVTINETEYDNSFVCTPYSQYVSYAYPLRDKITNPLLKSTFGILLGAYGKLMRLGRINKVVNVNNWLLTTNPPPAIDPENMPVIQKFLRERFPDHAIVFRAITKSTSPEAYDALKSSGFHFIASRYMYMLDGADESVFKTRAFRRDLRFMAENDLELIDSKSFSEDDITKAQELYHTLYIEKYSQINPMYNRKFIDHLMKNGPIRFLGLKEKGCLKGVIGFYHRKGTMASPLFGYEALEEGQGGIYRHLSTLLMLEAQKSRALFNMSAGGSVYKKKRNAQGEIEYMAVHIDHLSIVRRLPWMILKRLLNTIGKKVMKTY